MDILPPACITDDLITEILLLLSVKTIMRLKSVSKSWNALISDPTFIERHLKKSSQNPLLILTPAYSEYPMSSVVSLPVHRLLQNPSTTVSGDNFSGSVNNCRVIGSYNGLLCLLFNSVYENYREYQFCLWNPATGSISIKVGTFKEYNARSPFKFTFGCDISTGTYKVVAFAKQYKEHEVRVLSFGDNGWKNIRSFPFKNYKINDGVHLRGTVNWLALYEYRKPVYEYGWNSKSIVVNAKQSMIVSLDLSTETYTKILFPSSLEELPMQFPPTLQVLMDCLCFLHDWNETQFVIWHMKEFGVQESWTQLFRIDYCKIDLHSNFYVYTNSPLVPLYLSKNGDTLILADYLDDQAIIYSQRDMRVERIGISNKACRFSAMNYVESLVSTCWKSAIPTRSTFSVHSKEDDSEIGDMVADSSEEEEGIVFTK